MFQMIDGKRCSFGLIVSLSAIAVLQLSGCRSIVDSTSGDERLRDIRLQPSDSLFTSFWRITYSSNTAFEPECNKGAYQRSYSPPFLDTPNVTHVLYVCDSLALAHDAFIRLSTPDPNFVSSPRVLTAPRPAGADEFIATCGDWPNHITQCKFTARYGDVLSIVYFNRHTQAGATWIDEKDVLSMIVNVLDPRLSKLQHGL